MSYVGKITDTSGNTGLVGSTLYGTCSTDASTAAKVVTCADFDKLLTGVTIHVKFTNSNTASTPTLNVNSTGAKNIYKYGTTKPGTTAATSWYAGSVVSFTYDGSYWQMNDHIDDTTGTNTDEKVTQTATSTDADYEILFSNSANNTTETAGIRKNYRLIYNPSTGTINMKDTASGHLDLTPSTINVYDGVYGSNRFTVSNDEVTLTHLDSSLVNNNYIMNLDGTDITLSGASANTWDGTNTSLKSAISSLNSRNIIESGVTQNSDGVNFYYQKYSDNLIRFWATYDRTGTFASWGQIYSIDIASTPYPWVFSDTPVVSIGGGTSVSTLCSTNYNGMTSNSYYALRTGTPKVTFLRGTSVSGTYTFRIHIQGCGKITS